MYLIESSVILFKCESEHLVVLDEFSLIDHTIGQHGAPGALEVVVGVEDISRGVDGVSVWHLNIMKGFYFSKAHLWGPL